MVAAGVEVEEGRIWGWERRGGADGALCWEPTLLATIATKGRAATVARGGLGGRKVWRRRWLLPSRLTGVLGRGALAANLPASDHPMDDCFSRFDFLLSCSTSCTH